MGAPDNLESRLWKSAGPPKEWNGAEPLCAQLDDVPILAAADVPAWLKERFERAGFTGVHVEWRGGSVNVTGSMRMRAMSSWLAPVNLFGYVWVYAAPKPILVDPLVGLCAAVSRYALRPGSKGPAPGEFSYVLTRSPWISAEVALSEAVRDV